MYTQIRVTRDDQGSPVQVVVCVLDDHWEPLSESHQDLGPFDDLEIATANLIERVRTRARVAASEVDRHRDLEQDRLPFG